MHEQFHDKGIAYFGRESPNAIDKSCHTKNGQFASGYYFCPFPGCQKLAFSNCGENKCCGFFCPEHTFHQHFKCQYNLCNEPGKVQKYFLNNQMVELYCSDHHYHLDHIIAFGE